MFAVRWRVVLRLTLVMVAAWTIGKSATGEGPVVDDPHLAEKFSGQVVGPEGQPIGGARVYLAPNSEKPVGLHEVRAVTDADGRFEFGAPDMVEVDHDGLPARRAGCLSAVADGYGLDFLYTWSRQEALSQATRGREPQTSFELRLAKDDAPIRGRFLAPDGKPLVGARVRVTQLLVPRDFDLDAHLKREKNRSPLGCTAGYEHSLYWPHLLPEVKLETRTDEDGRFTLAGLGRDRLVGLKVTAPAIVDTTLTVMTRDAPDEQVRMGDDGITAEPPGFIFGANFTLLTQKGRTISGVVVDRQTQQPIAGMVVGRGREGYPRDGVWGHETVTDAAGRFAITGLDPTGEKWHLTATSSPGMSYQSASVTVTGDKPVTIECERGIPFRLKLVDEAGRPMDAEVEYFEVLPNLHAPKNYSFPSFKPLSVPARSAEGTYRGFIVPGPGVLLVKTPARLDYAPATIDPREFFAKRLVQLPPQEQAEAFGTHEAPRTVAGNVDPDDYAAIVLVDPQVDSPPLELTATIVTQRPRVASLVDLEGKPVVGVTTKGMTRAAYDGESPLRAAAFPLYRLHPERVRRIMFFQEERRLIGLLEARGDGQALSTVRMEPWGAVTGRLVGADGKPLAASIAVRVFTESGAELSGAHRGGTAEADGRFRLEQLLPGVRHTARAYGVAAADLGVVFENLAVRAGEVRDFGDVRVGPPAVAGSPRLRAWALAVGGW